MGWEWRIFCGPANADVARKLFVECTGWALAANSQGLKSRDDVYFPVSASTGIKKRGERAKWEIKQRLEVDKDTGAENWEKYSYSQEDGFHIMCEAGMKLKWLTQDDISHLEARVTNDESVLTKKSRVSKVSKGLNFEYAEIISVHREVETTAVSLSVEGDIDRIKTFLATELGSQIQSLGAPCGYPEYVVKIAETKTT
eukprot:m.51732 g.51732  ORF g.51732 m.51732 type:complete len:199 (+) comp10750_c0_seq1:715-1311(+)